MGINGLPPLNTPDLRNGRAGWELVEYVRFGLDNPRNPFGRVAVGRFYYERDSGESCVVWRLCT